MAGASIVVDVEEVLSFKELVTQWKFYPNPVVNQLQIVLDEEVKSFNWRLFDTSGQLVSSGSQRSNATSVNFGQIPGGIYLIMVEDGRGNVAEFRIRK